MTSALVASSNGPGAPALADDLRSVGIEVLTLDDCTKLLHAAIKNRADLAVLYAHTPDSAFFDSVSALSAAAPRPVVVFTADPDAEKMALAARSGIHAYVVNGYKQDRLRSLIHLAQARFRHDQLIREELAAVNQRFAERKLVDRAKGVLMGARQLREEEAYRALRSAAMHTKQRIGQVSQQVIDGARYAEAINRAGQLRMLSQRLVKLYALGCAGIRGADTVRLFAESLGQVDANLASLGRGLSKPTFGDLVDAVAAPWTELRAALAAPARVERLADIDRLAGDLLLRAEQLTANLEISGLASSLHVINVAGRQRMLSQRLAKEALLRDLLGRSGTGAADATRELVEGFAYLDALPLSNAAIRRELASAMSAWDTFEAALSRPGTKAGQDGIAVLSEVLLAHFEALTDQLERAMQSMVR